MGVGTGETEQTDDEDLRWKKSNGDHRRENLPHERDTKGRTKEAMADLGCPLMRSEGEDGRKKVLPFV